MTDITLGITITGDASGFRGEVKLTRDDLERLRKEAEGVGAAGGRAGRGMTDAENSARRLRGESQRLNEESRRTARGFDTVDRGSRQAGAGARALGLAYRELATVFAAYLGLRGAAALVGEADSWKLIEARLRNVTDSEAELSLVQEALFEIAQRTRQQLDSTVTLYQRVAAGRAELGRSAGEILQFTENIGKLAAVAGATSQEARNAIIQLSQGLASGELRGEELRSVMEQLPPVARAIAEHLGIGVGELRKMAEAGELTSDVVFDAILAKSEQINRQFANLPLTVDRAGEKLGNALQRWIGESETAGAGTALLAGSIEALAENLDTAIEVALTAAYAIGTVYAARAIAPAIAASYAFVAAKAATAAALTAEQRLFVAGAIASQRYALALGAARAASAFFGGPIGLAIVGVSAAMYLLAGRTEDAADATEQYRRAMELADQVNGTALENAEKLAAARRDDALAATDQAAATQRATIALIEQQRAAAQRVLDAPGFGAGAKRADQATFGGFLERSAGDLAEARQRLAELEGARAELLNPKASSRRGGGGGGGAASEAAAKVRAGLEDEAAALARVAAAWQGYGTSVAEARLQNDIDAALRDAKVSLLSEEGQAIAALVREIDGYQAAIDAAEETERRHADTVEDIGDRLRQTLPAYEQARQAAAAWRTEALAGLDRTKAGYDDFAAQVDEIFNRMMKDAYEENLRASRAWEDGVTRGFRAYAEEATNAARSAEEGVTSSLKSMEDALVGFATTGKLEFSSLVDSILADIARVAIRKNVTGPLADVLGSIDIGAIIRGDEGGFGVGGGGSSNVVALQHAGGIVGRGTPATRAVDPALFAGAPRYHGGGVVGLQPDERPIVARVGEEVLTEGDPRHRNNGGRGQEIVLRIVGQDGQDVPARQRRSAGGGLELELTVDQLVGKLGRRRGSETRRMLEDLGAGAPLRSV